MHTILKGTLVAAGALALVGPALAQNGGRPITVTMTGDEEVAAADEDGFGTFFAQVNPGQGRICYTLTVMDIEPATLAHVHIGDAGVAGPPVIDLIAPTGGSSGGCATISRELAKDLIQNPQDYYVNVHNTPFPAGAVRGQLG